MTTATNIQTATLMGAAFAAAGISVDSVIEAAQAAAPKKPGAKKSVTKKPGAKKSPAKPKAAKVTPAQVTQAFAEEKPELAELPVAEMIAMADSFDTLAAAFKGFGGQEFDLTADLSVRLEVFDFDKVKLVIAEGPLKGVFVTERETLGCQVLPFIPNLSAEMYQKKVTAHGMIRAIAVAEGLTEDRAQIEGAEAIRAIRKGTPGRYLIGVLNNRAVVRLMDSDKGLTFELVFFTGEDETLRRAGDPRTKGKTFAPYKMVQNASHSDKIPESANRLIDFILWCIRQGR